jgi:putative effector of murein hydrolase
MLLGIVILTYIIITYLVMINNASRFFILLPGWMIIVYSLYEKNIDNVKKYRTEISLAICLGSIISVFYGMSQW